MGFLTTRRDWFLPVLLLALMAVWFLRPARRSEIYLWAWERPEDLRFLENSGIGVAYLSGTLQFASGKMRVLPRMQPMRVAADTRLIAVVRMEAEGQIPETLVTGAASAIQTLTRRPRVESIQIDFDAVVSQRPFYRALVERLAESDKPAITALASWCFDDTWIKGLPISDAIPMLFQMGPDTRVIRRMLADGRDFSVPECRNSLGIGTDEALPRIPSGRRIYLFHPRAWTSGELRDILGTLRIRR